MIFITNNKPTEVLKPGKQTFDLPSLSESSQYSTILRRRFDSIVFVWSNQLNASFFGQTFIKFIAIISSVTNDFVRDIVKKTGIKSIINKSYLMRAGTCCANGDRKTESVRKAHNLGSFAPFGL